MHPTLRTFGRFCLRHKSCLPLLKIISSATSDCRWHKSSNSQYTRIISESKFDEGACRYSKAKYVVMIPRSASTRRIWTD